MTGTPELDDVALAVASFALAKVLKWEQGPVPVDAIDALAARIRNEAEHHVPYLHGQGRDPNIVTRIIEYITHHHGGPWGEQVAYVRGMIDVLVELACPNSQPIKASGALYDEVEKGIAHARAEAI